MKTGLSIFENFFKDLYPYESGKGNIIWVEVHVIKKLQSALSLSYDYTNQYFYCFPFTNMFKNKHLCINEVEFNFLTKTKPWSKKYFGCVCTDLGIIECEDSDEPTIASHHFILESQ